MRLALLCLLLSGCTLNIVDRRVDPVELGKAIETLTKNQDVIVQSINKLNKELPKKAIR